MKHYTLQQGFTNENHWCCFDNLTGLICSWDSTTEQKPIFSHKDGLEKFGKKNAAEAVADMIIYLSENHTEIFLPQRIRKNLKFIGKDKK